MVFAVNPHPPVVAFGIDDEKTLTATPAEGSTVMEMDNSTDAIAVGDPVFVRSLDESVLQYRGPCTVSGAAQITVRVPLQDAVGASATAWKPTNSVVFTGEIRDSQRILPNDGAKTIINNAGAPLGFQFRDPFDIIQLSLWDYNATLINDYKTFLVTGRRGSIDAFNLGYYDQAERKTKTIKVRVEAGEHPMTVVSFFSNSVTERFILIAESVYVES